MDRFSRSIALLFASGTLMSVTPPVSYSAELLAMLDPTVRVASLCGGKDAGSMRANLMLSAAVLQGVETPAPSIPLVGGLGKVHFPITTSNPLAQRYFDQGLGYAYGFNHAAAVTAFREAQ